MHGGEDLYLAPDVAPRERQFLRTKAKNFLRRFFFRLHCAKLEGARRRAVRHPSGVDGVRIANDDAFLRLTKNFSQAQAGNDARAQDFLEHRSRADGGKLIGVANENNMRAGRHRR